MKIIFIVLLIAIASAAEVRTVKLADITDNSYVPIQTNNKIIFEVEGNPTTGYIWTIGNTDKLKEDRIIKPSNLDEKNSGVFYKSPSEKIGVGGVYHFEFETNEKQGHEIIQFMYKRPWTDEGKIIKNVNVNVVQQTNEL
jgi:predicted secreted protein